jgi:hypothetical protein
MSRPAPFKQADIKRAVAGAQAAGLTVASVDVCRETGRITVHAAGATPAAPSTGYDAWKARRNAG